MDEPATSVRAYLDRAKEARERADAAVAPEEREYHLTLENLWLELAAGLELWRGDEE